MKKGFTLIEMLVVIGIIAILVSASLGGFSAMRKTAEKARAQELVSNAATALTALFQQEGIWPKRLLNGKKSPDGGQLLDENAAYALVAGSTKYFSLTVKDGKLAGLDKFGVITPWATAVIKRKGGSAERSTEVSSGATIENHILRYALDLDGDGIIEGVEVGGERLDIRATAVVWCCGRDGKIAKYGVAGNKAGNVYSWTPGQTRNVK